MTFVWGEVTSIMGRNDFLLGRSDWGRNDRNSTTHQTYEVSVSKLACQFSSFFVQNFVRTTSALYKEWPLCTNNAFTLNEQCWVGMNNFVQTTLTLYVEQCHVCTNYVNFFVQRTTTLHKQCCHFEWTMSTLYEQSWVCFEHRCLYKNPTFFSINTQEIINCAR